MSAFTSDDIEAGIVKALKAGDLDAVAALVRALVTLDPDRAQQVFDTLELGVALARRRSATNEAVEGDGQ